MRLFSSTSLGLLSLLVACGATQPPATPAQPASPGKLVPTASASAPEPSVALADPVTLLASGSEPRVRLRYAPKPNSREESLLRSTSELLGLPIGKAGELPPALVLAELDLRATDANGVLVFEALAGSVPTLAEPAKLVAKGSLRVTSRGIPAELAFDEQSPFEPHGPATELSGPVGIIVGGGRYEPDWDMGPNLAFESGDLRARSDGPVLLGLDRLIVPLPEPAVGVGAKWSVSETVDEGGIHLELTTEYELVEWRPGGVEVRSSSSVRLNRGSSDALPPESQAVLENASVRGTATHTVLFERLLPKGRSELDMKTVFQPDSEGAAEREPMEVRRRQVLEVEPWGVQGLSAFPTWSTLNVPRTRWWPINYCSSLHGDRSGHFAPLGAAGARGECAQGKPEGPWVSRGDGSGRLSGEFVQGVPSGTWVEEGADGGRRGEYTLRAGSGTIIEWWPSGAKRLESEFRGGKPEGRFATWHENGQPHLLGSFSAGRKAGRWTEHDPSGAALGQWLIDPGCRIVDTVVAGTPAEKARIAPGDVVLASGKTPLESPVAVRAAVEAAGAVPLVLSLERQGKPVKVRVTPAVTGGGPPRIGISFACHRELAQ